MFIIIIMIIKKNYDLIRTLTIVCEMSVVFSVGETV